MLLAGLHHVAESDLFNHGIISFSSNIIPGLLPERKRSGEMPRMYTAVGLA